MIQIDGTKKHVCLKLTYDTYITNKLQTINGRLKYKHTTGEISVVRLQIAGMGTRRIRIADLPHEISDRAIRTALAPYGVVALHDKVWSKMYRYPVANGIRVATMKVTKHLPSHMAIAGDRVIVSHEGQPVSCYACGGTCHMQQT
jgi:hypothetical protein